MIAPYRGQVRLLRAALPAALEVNTVDQYQGRDKSVILYSCTRTAARRTGGHEDGDAVSAGVGEGEEGRRRRGGWREVWADVGGRCGHWGGEGRDAAGGEGGVG